MATKQGPDKNIGQNCQFTFAIYIMKYEIGHWRNPPSLSSISSQDHFLPAHETSGPRRYPSILMELFASTREIHANKQGHQGLICGKRKGKGCIRSAVPRFTTNCHGRGVIECFWYEGNINNGELFHSLYVRDRFPIFSAKGIIRKESCFCKMETPPRIANVPRSYG